NSERCGRNSRAAAGVRVSLKKPGENCPKFCLCAGERYTAGPPSDGLPALVSVPGMAWVYFVQRRIAPVRIGCDRSPELLVSGWELERLRHHPDNLKRLTIDVQVLADCAGRRPKPPGPESMT